MSTTTRVALVSGANRGIGLEIVRQLAREGVMACLGTRDVKAGARAVESLQREGLDAPVIALDVSYSASVTQAVAEVEGLFGRCDILVNNAGILLDREGDLSSKNTRTVGIDAMRATFEVNVVGPLRLIQAVFPLMEREGYGRIVNVSSRLGQLDEMDGGMTSYRVSKTALNALTRTAAADFADVGIKVNAMSPGWVRTDMGGANATSSVEQGADTAVWLAMLDDDGPTGGFFADRKPIAW